MDYVEARNNETQKPSGGMHLAQALWSLNSPGVESPGRQAYPRFSLRPACGWGRAGDAPRCSTGPKTELIRRLKHTKQRSEQGEVICLSEGHRAEIRKDTGLGLSDVLGTQRNHASLF